MPKPFFTYILRCADGSFYTGHTDDLLRRAHQHRLGEMAAYTQTRRPVRLVWFCEHATRDEAKAAEVQIKCWSRAKKLALIEGRWEELRELSRSRRGRAK